MKVDSGMGQDTFSLGETEISLFQYAKTISLPCPSISSPLLHFGLEAARDIGITEESFLIQRCSVSIH